MSIESLELSTVSLIHEDMYAGMQMGCSTTFDMAMSSIAKLTQAEAVMAASLLHDLANEELRIILIVFMEGSVSRHRFSLKDSDRKNLAANDLLFEAGSFGAGNEVAEHIQALVECQSFLKSLSSSVSPGETNSIQFSTLLALLHSMPFGDVSKFDHEGFATGWLSTFAFNEVQALSSNFSSIYSAFKVLLANSAKQIAQKNQINTYQQVLDLMPQRVFWKNRRSVYLGANQAFANDASKLTPMDLVGVTDYDIFPEQAELFRGDDANTMHSGEHMINSEEPQTHANGRTIWLRTSKRPITSADNEVIGVVGTYEEITELKQMQAQLQQSKDELEKRVEDRTVELATALVDLKATQNQMVESEKMAALGGLVAGVAHEINTPIGISVTGASHLQSLALDIKNIMSQGALTKSKFDRFCQELVEASDVVLENLNRAAEQISNFKLVAVDQTDDHIRKVDFNAYIDSVVKAVLPTFRNNSVSVNVDIEALTEGNIYPGALSQIVTNLIENAIVHGFSDRKSGTITITGRKKEASFELSFSDNGKGIDKESVGKIFDPFFTTRRGDGGSGLGLNIVYNLVTQKMGGRITCISQPSEGTTFLMTIPL